MPGRITTSILRQSCFFSIAVVCCFVSLIQCWPKVVMVSLRRRRLSRILRFAKGMCFCFLVVRRIIRFGLRIRLDWWWSCRDRVVWVMGWGGIVRCVGGWCLRRRWRIWGRGWRALWRRLRRVRSGEGVGGVERCVMLFLLAWCSRRELVGWDGNVAWWGRFLVSVVYVCIRRLDGSIWWVDSAGFFAYTWWTLSCCFCQGPYCHRPFVCFVSSMLHGNQPRQITLLMECCCLFPQTRATLACVYLTYKWSFISLSLFFFFFFFFFIVQPIFQNAIALWFSSSTIWSGSPTPPWRGSPSSSMYAERVERVGEGSEGLCVLARSTCSHRRVEEEVSWRDDGLGRSGLRVSFLLTCCRRCWFGVTFSFAPYFVRQKAGMPVTLDIEEDPVPLVTQVESRPVSPPKPKLTVFQRVKSVVKGCG